ncbi:DUF927 domain-containing protein [Bacillus thuringiensis]|uniref:DUF927 domain-containing protein n=1 Tax=Bacillus thuringiensis TaxID=1428 RepID=UPI0029606424|nr:DUF927 domain-containing protein [Bacillus cereus]HEF1867623.1 DUF927 domain-containing protein [Bacillus cereus]HEF1878805.1 DUF927 domain-containing protein [Bacillus cereus]HEF1884790.1 DUF927 domain-containing protein [Bacillus cereus]
MLHTMPSYTERIQEVLPHAKIIRLIGYTNGNKEYQKAKCAAGKWQTTEALQDEKIHAWIQKGGWIGVRIPEGRIVVDIDDKTEGALLRELLEGERIHHHSITTPNGWQFIFRGETELTRQQGQYQKYVNRLGLVQDTRAAEKGYIVFPTENTEGRYLVTQSLTGVDELPTFLYKVWNGMKHPSPMAYPYEKSGSRDGDFYDMARRLLTCGVSQPDALESLQLAYQYFVPYKKDFPFQTVQEKVESAWRTVSSGENKAYYERKGVEIAVEDRSKNRVIPKPFKVGANATLFEEKEDKDGNVITKLVSRKTPYITKEFHNIERPQVLYEIEWQEQNRTVKEVVPASTIAVRKELLELSDRGFSVHDNNAKRIITYFDQYLLVNEINQHEAVERLGFIKDRFIHPSLTKDVEIMAIDHGEKQLLEAVEVKGTGESWKQEVFARIKQNPKAVFFILASFASVIIQDLRLQPFIVDLSGTTSQGKTTTLKAAASVWGNERLMSEWNATKVSIERKAAYLNSFPLLLDDTRKANERILKDAIYQFSGGRSKGRGSLKGSQREFMWHNILLSTGEVSLNEYAKNQGGAAARIIPLIDEPLGKDHGNIMHLHEAMENNYGAIGIEFLQVWLANKKVFLSEYARFRKHYVEKAKGNEVLTRLAGYYAAVHFTGSILKETLQLDVNLQAISHLFDEIAKENKATDKPMQFLEEILTDLDSSRQDIFYTWEPQNNKAIYKGGQLYMMPAFTSKFLGLEEKATRREWLKRGITVGKQEKESYVDYRQVKHKGKNFRAIPVNMEYVEQLGFDFEEIHKNVF